MRRAFTLIELLIVVLIVGILATVALPQYTKVVEKARWTEAVSMLGSIRKACLVYYAEKGIYPNVSGEVMHLNYGTNIYDVLVIDIPAPQDGRYYYKLATLPWAENQGKCAAAMHDYNGSGTVPGFSEPTLWIHYDGTFSRQGDPLPPEF